MNPTPSTSTTGLPAGLTPNLRHAFGGIWRLTLGKFLAPRRWPAVASLLAVLGLIVYGFLDAGNGPRLYLGWTIGFYFTFVVPVMAFITAAGAMRDEMKPATVDYVLTRPVPRPAFVIFKYLAHVAGAQVDFLLSFGVILGAGLVRQAPGLIAAAPLLLLAQILLVTAFSALGFLCGVLTSRYVVLGLLYAVIIEVGVGQIPTELNRLSMTHQVKTMLQPLAAEAASKFTFGIQTLPPDGKLATVGVLLAFSAVLLALTAAVFAVRELTGSGEA
ncbi:MAG TPA: ABC transporter permease subunit [Opitutaceae bacterium]|nr:ABC transporter permease subunit [Opitutaceae bacterium]